MYLHSEKSITCAVFTFIGLLTLAGKFNIELFELVKSVQKSKPINIPDLQLRKKILQHKSIISKCNNLQVKNWKQFAERSFI